VLVRRVHERTNLKTTKCSIHSWGLPKRSSSQYKSLKAKKPLLP
jgi:hypothetical protein